MLLLSLNNKHCIEELIDQAHQGHGLSVWSKEHPQFISRGQGT